MEDNRLQKSASVVIAGEMKQREKEPEEVCRFGSNAERIDELERRHDLPDEDFLALLTGLTEEEEAYLYHRADAVRRLVYGNEVYLRGLIEFSSYCKNDCYYCGIRCSNRRADRYRLTEEDILNCCARGYALGFRTFVMQSGEDPWFTDTRICSMVSRIRTAYPDCAITLSIGEKEKESYRSYFDAGANRYLLRQETANEEHYRMLHPSALSSRHRKQCLRDLKEIGYQVGCGIMVGSPGQKPEYILEDIRYMQKLQPHMIGIGPFIPHKDTPFADRSAGRLPDTLHLLGILRLIFPHVLLPATTALGTIHVLGRKLGIRAGANVIMLNLSPADVRGKYLLYDGKLCRGEEAAESCRNLIRQMAEIGYEVKSDRGDYR